MSKKDDYNLKLEVIKAIPEDKIISPRSIPVNVYIQEAENVYHWCQDDKDALVATGLDWKIVEDIPVRSGALAEAESIWVMERFGQEEAQTKWKQDAPPAYNLRNLILHHFRYAYRKDDALLGRVNAIADGSGHADMIQDLNDLSVLGKANPEPLTKINFDMNLLEQAAKISSDLTDLWAMATGDRMEYSEKKKIRDQAYTHLKEAVDELRECGQYVFWHNDARIKMYRSLYMQRVKNKLEKKKAEKPETQKPEDNTQYPVEKKV